MLKTDGYSIKRCAVLQIEKGSQRRYLPRPIVSLPRTLTYRIATELWRHLKPLIRGSKHSLINTHQILDNLKDVTLEDQLMVSFVVTVLSTSNDRDIAKMITKKPLHQHYLGKPEKTQTVYELLQTCLDKCFKFNGDVCEQTKGTPKEPPISGFLAEPVMQMLNNMAISRIQSKL